MTREGVGVFVLLLLVLSSSSPRQSISVDPQFHACVPKNCGNLSISFPFWIIGVQEAFCGLPGFHLYCDGDPVSGRTLLNLSTSVYVVTEICYRDQYLRVAMNALYIWECDSRYEQNLENSHFVVVPNQEELVLLTNCTERVQGEISTHALGNCSDSSGTSGPVAVVFGGKWDAEDMAKECTGKTRVPATLHGDESKEVFLDSGLYNEVVGRGFLLRWTAPECYLCVGSGGRCGFDVLSYHYRCFCPDGPHVRNCTPTPSNGNFSKKLRIAIGSGGAAIFILMICLVLFIMRRGYRQKTASSGLISKDKDRDTSLKSELDTGSAYCGVPIFPYHELEKATNYFDSTRELGDGGFGTVYYGILQDGREVAVKRLYENNYKRVQQFMNEIKILTRLRHKNLVTLYGCTSLHSRELLLVYEFIANGTVADHVHGDRATHTSLAWPVRLRIAAEAANALAYLHASGIIHRDVKTSNILLDNSFSVKVADFGLSRLFPTDATHVSTAPQGTPGYVDPEYHKCYQLTERSDVYSFGVVLIELISSLPAVDISRDKEEINLANLAVNRIQNQEFSEFLDPCLRFESDLAVRKMVVLVAELAFRCLQPDREQRPSMGEVLKTLKSIQGEHDDVDQARESAADDDNSDIAINPLTGSVDRTTPAVPETEDGVLLKGTHSFTSPISVTDTWASRSTISSSSTV